MYTTITGELVLRQPRPDHPPRLWPRQREVQIPAAWVALVRERWEVTAPQSVVLDSWSGLWSCRSTQVHSWCQRLMLWQTIPETWEDLTARGITPHETLLLIETAYLGGHLSLEETRLLQRAILAHTGPEGQWKGTTL
jgi:hypothetical protein